jgi:hypothetical protein
MNAYTIIRTDQPSRNETKCSSLDEAKRCAETEWEIAHYTDKPTLDITDNRGKCVATFNGQWF